MANTNNDIDYKEMKKYAKQCKTELDKLKKLNGELDDKVIELQKYWKTKRANKMYKKFKGNIDHNYQYYETYNNLISSIQTTSDRVVAEQSD